LSYRGKDLGQFAEILGGCGEQEPVICVARAKQSVPSKPKYAIEVGKQHLDLLPELLFGGIRLARRALDGSDDLLDRA